MSCTCECFSPACLLTWRHVSDVINSVSKSSVSARGKSAAVLAPIYRPPRAQVRRPEPRRRHQHARKPVDRRGLPRRPAVGLQQRVDESDWSKFDDELPLQTNVLAKFCTPYANSVKSQSREQKAIYVDGIDHDATLSMPKLDKDQKDIPILTKLPDDTAPSMPIRRSYKHRYNELEKAQDRKIIGSQRCTSKIRA